MRKTLGSRDQAETGSCEKSAPANHLFRIARLTGPEGSGWHTHRDLQWVAAGHGLLVLETEEAQWFALPGQALLVASSVPHNLRWFGAASVVSAYIEPDALRVAEGVPCVRSTVSDLMRATALALADEALTDAGRAERRAALLSGIFLDEVLEGGLETLSLPNPVSRGLRMLCLRLREQPSASTDLDTCAQIAGMTRRTFTRRFSQETGVSFNEWTRHLRAFCALIQIILAYSPKQISSLCGYKSTNYMQSEFIKILGVSMMSLKRKSENVCAEPKLRL